MNPQNFEYIGKLREVEMFIALDARRRGKSQAGVRRSAIIKMVEILHEMSKSKDPLTKERYNLMILEREYIRVQEKNRLKERILKGNFRVGGDYTLSEIAKIFGITRERVRQIESVAIKKIRSPRFARMLKAYTVE